LITICQFGFPNPSVNNDFPKPSNNNEFPQQPIDNNNNENPSGFGGFPNSSLKKEDDFPIPSKNPSAFGNPENNEKKSGFGVFPQKDNENNDFGVLNNKDNFQNPYGDNNNEERNIDPINGPTTSKSIIKNEIPKIDYDSDTLHKFDKIEDLDFQKNSVVIPESNQVEGQNDFNPYADNNNNVNKNMMSDIPSSEAQNFNSATYVKKEKTNNDEETSSFPNPYGS
jgi:hypothetical protein